MAKPLRKFRELNKKLSASVHELYALKSEFHRQIGEGRPKIDYDDFKERIDEAKDVLNEMNQEWKKYFESVVFTVAKRKKDEKKKKGPVEDEPEPPRRKSKK